jgi:hypothetical protein
MKNFDFQKKWNILWTTATFLTGILSTFLFSPPAYITQEQIFSNFGRFVAAIVVGLIMVATLFWGLREHTRNWWITALLSLILFTTCLFLYQRFTQKWTCRCDKAEKVIYLIGPVSGIKSSPTDSVRENPDPSNCQLWLFENDCDPEVIWTKDSIDKNRLILGGIYILSLSLGVICMMSVVQAIYCSLRRQR